VFKPSTWKVAFKGVDGVVFVADSTPERQQDNLNRLKELHELLAVEGGGEPIPFVIQYNGRDLPDALPLEELQRKLNRDNVPGFPTVASHGEGVHAPLSCLTNMILANIREELDAELEAQLAVEAEEEEEVEAKSAVEPSFGREIPVPATSAPELEEMEFELSDEMGKPPSPPEARGWAEEDEVKEEEEETILPALPPDWEREEPLASDRFPEEPAFPLLPELAEWPLPSDSDSAKGGAEGSSEIGLTISAGGHLENGALMIPVTVTVGTERRDFQLVVSLVDIDPRG
jgi:ADP-ribosylation factor family